MAINCFIMHHPGAVLLEEFLKPMGLNQHLLASSMHIPLQRVNDIISGKQVITAEIALRLSIALGTTAEFWMGLQSDYDLETTFNTCGEQLRQDIVPLRL